MIRRVAAALALVLVAAGAAGCPRLPPLPPRPSARLVSFALTPVAAGLAAAARLEVENRGDRGLLLDAVDWELVAADEPLLRGRVALRRSMARGQRAIVDLPIAVPAALTGAVQDAVAVGRLRLRGTAHLESLSAGSGAPAPFDDPARPRAPGSARATTTRSPPFQSTPPARQQPFEQ